MRSRRFRKAASPAVVAFAFALTTPLAADAEGGQETKTVCVEMELSAALSVGAIEGVFQGTGASSGDSITLRARSTHTLAVCPCVRPGTVLANANAAAQDMLLAGVRGTPAVVCGSLTRNIDGTYNLRSAT